jgi:flagellar basal body-associated protein FliL
MNHAEKKEKNNLFLIIYIVFSCLLVCVCVCVCVYNGQKKEKAKIANNKIVINEENKILPLMV